MHVATRAGRVEVCADGMVRSQLRESTGFPLTACENQAEPASLVDKTSSSVYATCDWLFH